MKEGIELEDVCLVAEVESDDDKNMLPLKRISFLGSNE